MDAIFDFMHKCCAWAAYIVALVLIDFPLKAILCVIFLVLGLLLSIFYPLVKKRECARWISNLYGYTTGRIWIAEKIWEAWND
jgi:hypothetical protein